MQKHVVELQLKKHTRFLEWEKMLNMPNGVQLFLNGGMKHLPLTLKLQTTNSELNVHKFRIECVMLAEREKCDRFLTTILIPDPKFETFFNLQINPAPIGIDEESVIVVHKTSMTKIFTTDDRGKYNFEINSKVSEKRPHQDNNIN